MILQSPCSQSSETRQLRKLARLEPKKNVCSEYVELFYRLHFFKVTGFKSLRETERPYSIYSPKLASLRFFSVSGDGERGLCIAYTVGQPCFLIAFVRNRKIHVDF